MNKTQQRLLTAIAWLIGTIAFIPLSLELFLFEIADYDIYRVLNISLQDVIVLTLLLIAQYGLLSKLTTHLDFIWQATQTHSNKICFLTSIAVATCLFYALLPTRFPFWISFIVLLSLVGCYFFFKRSLFTSFYKVAFLLLLGAGMNSSLLFWMHEEANEGRHIRYAQQLAERRDTIAENLLVQLADLGKTIPEGTDVYDFWEKQWLNSSYLSSNYRINVTRNIRGSSSQPYYQPIFKINKASIPTYTLFFPDDYALTFNQDKHFIRSIYSSNQHLKQLNELDDFHFAVIDKSRIILSNTHAFDSHILDIELPKIGEGEKIELKGFDVIAYRASDQVFVLIGEPLSEAQVWIANFAFFFTLLLSIVIFFQLIQLLFLKKKVFDYWQELPIQFRIQLVLVGITCLLFFIVASATFLFLDQNNAAIAHERQVYISEQIREEILQEKEQFNWTLSDLSVDFLAELSNRNRCDIDLYKPDGSIANSSFASANNSPAPRIISQEIVSQIKQNISLVVVKRVLDTHTEEPILKTYFGLYQEDQLQGIASVSAFELDIGTSPYIPIVMEKLLGVYVFLLLIAWVGGLLLISLLTKPLELLANRLSNFKLGKQNKKLRWKGDDAIGQLIAEYNKMVDKLEETTQELIRSEREGAWQVMAQQIAHEINNKLTPLRLNVQFLTRIVSELNPDESESIRRITNGLVEKIDGLSKTASQFQLFAQLETPEVESIELKRFITQFLDNYHRKEAYQYSFNLKPVEEDNPIIKIDRRHLEEVLTNLISNAENAIPTDKHGRIEVSLGTENDYVIIEVADNGKGIDGLIRKNLFDPKFSVTSSQTGLGLPICKRIIEFYRGSLDFTTTKGEGTTFMIRFPLTKIISLETEERRTISV